jgi:hypothetical protein
MLFRHLKAREDFGKKEDFENTIEKLLAGKQRVEFPYTPSSSSCGGNVRNRRFCDSHISMRRANEPSYAVARSGEVRTCGVNRHGHVLFAKNIFRYIYLISPVTNVLVNLPHTVAFLIANQR